MKSRICLYGAALVAAFLLIWFGFIKEPEPTFDELKTKAINLLQEGKEEEARHLLEEMCEDFPDAVQAPLLLGWLYECGEDLPAARIAYERAISRCTTDEQRRDIMVSIAELHRREGDLSQAEQLLRKATDQYGNGERSRRLRVALLIEKREFKEALNEVETLAEEEPVSPHVRQLRRLVMEQMTKAESR